MANKMYYTDEEAAAKLGVDVATLEQMVSDGKLRSYADGAKTMFKVSDVDALAGAGGEVDLAPAEGDTVSISEADSAPGPESKDDTVITAEGISIFDDEDLEIEAADPMAKTQIAPSIEDQISLEGVGSGSGLLDLTRESDDTSLGAEVLDHIDMEGEVGSGLGSGLVGSGLEEEPATYAQPEVQIVEAAPAEVIDPTAGLFNGLLIGASLLAMLIGTLSLAAMTGRVPEFVNSLQDNMAGVVIGGVVVLVAAAAAGFFVGKSTATRKEALRRVS